MLYFYSFFFHPFFLLFILSYFFFIYFPSLYLNVTCFFLLLFVCLVSFFLLLYTRFAAWRACAPGPTPRRPPIAHNGHDRDGISNPLSIAYASRPRLRPASPADDQHGCGTLGHSVRGIRTPFALLVPTFALPSPPGSLPLPLHRRMERSPTTHPSGRIRGFGAGLSPGGLSAPRHDRPVSYYALFQGWLLLSQPPGCQRAATTLPTKPELGDLSRRSGLFPSRPRNLAPVVSLPRSTRRHSTFGSGW